MNANFYEQMNRAEALVPCVEYVEKPHWSSEESAKRYDVVLNGVVVGQVETTIRHGYRMAGSLITKHFKPAREWRFESPDINHRSRVSETTRKRATYNLLLMLIRLGKLQ